MRSIVFLFFPMLTVAGEYTVYLGDIYPRSMPAIATDAASSRHATVSVTTLQFVMIQVAGHNQLISIWVTP
jgi:amino acid permease